MSEKVYHLKEVSERVAGQPSREETVSLLRKMASDIEDGTVNADGVIAIAVNVNLPGPWEPRVYNHGIRPTEIIALCEQVKLFWLGVLSGDE